MLVPSCSTTKRRILGRVDANLDAYELDAERGGPGVFSQNWHRRNPRDLV